MDTNKARAKFLSAASSPRKLVTFTYHKPTSDDGPIGMHLKLSDAGQTPINFRHTASQCGDDLEITLQALMPETGPSAVGIAFWPEDFGTALRLLIEYCDGRTIWPDHDDDE